MRIRRLGDFRHVYDLALGGQTATRALMALLIMAWHGIGFWLAPHPALAFDPTSQPLRRYPFYARCDGAPSSLAAASRHHEHSCIGCHACTARRATCTGAVRAHARASCRELPGRRLRSRALRQVRLGRARPRRGRRDGAGEGPVRAGHAAMIARVGGVVTFGTSVV